MLVIYYGAIGIAILSVIGFIVANIMYFTQRLKISEECSSAQRQCLKDQIGSDTAQEYCRNEFLNGNLDGCTKDDIAIWEGPMTTWNSHRWLAGIVGVVSFILIALNDPNPYVGPPRGNAGNIGDVFAALS